ncbi:cytochrome P450 [Aquincola sp. S2]|uniref:Cytochrome P450 n=1 Tax=Pseudaquabacterium terrae TaxID=2732868 RepID=A0ABX2EJN3_9BURK|nr:cytochrome P450 [Aquabacterium terrae]NRF68856.1 cytochrome P450 [Aquabacterium terrae]
MDQPIAGALPATRSYRDLPGPRPLPLIGNLHQVDKVAFHRSLEDGVAAWGPMYRFAFGRTPALVIADAALMPALMRDRPDALRRSSRLSRMLDGANGSSGLFTAEGEAWRAQRKLVTRALTPEVIRKFQPTLHTLVLRLERRWRRAAEQGAEIDLARDLKALTLDVTVALAMGEDVNTLEHPENPLQRDIHFLFERVGARLRSMVDYWTVFKLPVDRAADAATARVRAKMLALIAHARAELQADPALRVRPVNLLQAMLVARDAPDSGVDDEAVLGNALTMVFAGEDTTSSTLAWLLVLLAQHPEVAQALAAECDAVLGDAPAVSDAALLEQLHYTEAVIHETLRLKPAAPVQAVETPVEREVGGVRVPAGTRVFMLTRLAALDPARFDAPLDFRPERWAGHTDPASEPNRKMLPFGGGPRFCPGRYLALVEAKLVASMIARNFRLEPLPGLDAVREVFTFTMNPSAVPVRLRPR